MLKYVLLAIFAANVIYIVLAADCQSNSNKSSYSSASGSASSSSFSSTNTSGSKSSAYSSSQSSSSSNSSSNSTKSDDEDDDNCETENQCTGANEEYVSCPDCSPQTCDSIGKIYHCPLETTKNCNGTCRCISGYYRNIIGECISKDECLQNKCTGDNEEYVSCPDCSPQTCDSIGKIYHCPLENTENCNGTCRCKNGYYRNIIGECISKAECSMCNGTHEYFTCGGACDNVCGILHKQNQTNCPIINKRCNRKCYCEEGYARDSNDKCVAIKDCKVNKCNCTKPNEVYDTCPVPCPFRTCGIDDRLVFCAPPEECPPPACRCQDGFFRDDKGNCVKWNDCPKCKMPNEEYDPCPAPCPPRRCDVDDRLIRCKAPPKLGNPECKPGCRCSDGFAKNDKGICIPRDKCGKLKHFYLTL